ncbi:hypothetical protein A4A49_40637 [Nicotiana attenuata]|uniref:DUF4283 domain-containing protein n=1 Tax=Nicotiana attenuata TaxID=49451 RepID=A0A1J6IKL4_NICAT|nr:hypothetical protein A4A49_40637 [Nicotiana attenuata]
MQHATNVALKPIEYLHGEPIVRWKKQEVRQSIAQQGLNLAVLGKFSYGKPGIHGLRKVLPIQCELKSPCSVGLIEDSHVLIKLSLMEDYIHLLSKPAYYLRTQNEMWQMRCTKWNPWWKVDEETPIAITWISFQDLPPNFFGREFVFSLARAVGRPLHVDLATQNGTRPSCAKQGHKEEECWVINSELRRLEEQTGDVKDDQNIIGTAATTTKVLTSGKVVGKPITNPAKQEWMQARKNKYKRDKRGYVIDESKKEEYNKGNGKNKGKDQVIKGSSKVQQKEKRKNGGDQSPDPNFNGSNGGIATGGGSGASKEAGNQGGSVHATMSKKMGNGIVNPSKSGEILAFVDRVPVYALEKGADEGVPINVRRDTMLNPKLSSVYELQFNMMHEKLGDMVSDSDKFKAALTPYEPGEHAIVSRESEALPMACSSGTGSPIQIKVNMPLKLPNQVLHDLITHQELPLEIQNSLVEQQKEFEEEGDDESTVENFKGVMREGDVSPTAANRSGKKGKKNQSKEPLQPTRILPRKAASTVSR